MFKLKTSLRLAIIVTAIVGGNLWLAISLHMIPDAMTQRFNGRVREAQALGSTGAILAESGKIGQFQSLLEQACLRETDLLSAGLTRSTGGYRIETQDHSANWIEGARTPNQIAVDIQFNGRNWGQLQLRYAPLRSGKFHSSIPFANWLPGYPLNAILFVSSTTCMLAWLMFSRVFRYLDPSKVVPGRVRSALDTLAEGLVLLDPNETIVHVNGAFGKMLDIDPDKLIGKDLGIWTWKLADDTQERSSLPWSRALRERRELNGILLHLEIHGETRKYLVNTNPIIGDKQASCRGALVSFDDVTQLERKKQDLAETIESLRHSRDEIRQQNERLKFLASRDPLTRCFNRRSFWELFEEHWNTVDPRLLNVMMVDIDHFKSINDRHGHSTGDNVLRETGAMLLHLIGNRGLVCRYGGEEFAILLPNLDLQSATDVAHAIHNAFQHCSLGGLNVTASIGLSNRSFGAMDAQHLLDQSDQCLYVAKRNGRNQVVRFDKAKEKKIVPDTEVQASGKTFERIPYTVVSTLFDVIRSRDPGAAMRAQNLADFCVGAARGIVDRCELYWLEVAALLHRCGTVVEAVDSRGRKPAADETADVPSFLRKTPASVFVGSILGECEPVQILRRWESGMEGDGTENCELTNCHAVWAICSDYLQLLESGRSSTEAVDSLKTNHRTEFDGRVIENLQKVRIDELPKNVSPQAGLWKTTLARFHAPLNMGVQEKSQMLLSRTTQSMREETAELECNSLRESLAELEKLAGGREPDYGRIAAIVDSIDEIGREIRRSSMGNDDGFDLSNLLLDLPVDEDRLDKTVLLPKS